MTDYATAELIVRMVVPSQSWLNPRRDLRLAFAINGAGIASASVQGVRWPDANSKMSKQELKKPVGTKPGNLVRRLVRG
jgi:hypothetical protein